MNENELNSKEKTDIRKQAEEVLKGKSTDTKKLSSDDVQSLVHELQVHQIELEMQNEELRRAQQELEDARNKYRDLYDFAPLGYFTLDKNGMILEVNLTAAKKLGTKRFNLIKTPLSLYIAPEYKDVFYLYLRKFTNNETQATCELRLVDKYGNQFDALLEGMPVHNGDGSLVCRTAMSDITQRKLVEEVIQKFNEELEQRVRERTAELEKKNIDLATMNNGFMTREGRIIELKKQIAELQTMIAGFVGQENRMVAIKNKNIKLEEEIGELKKARGMTG